MTVETKIKGATQTAKTRTVSTKLWRIRELDDKGQVIFWDAQTGTMLHDIPDAQKLEIDSVAYSPDGRWAVSGSKDGTDKFWDPHTFKLLHEITGNPGRTESMTFSPDGKTFVTGFGGDDHGLKLWDLSSWK